LAKLSAISNPSRELCSLASIISMRSLRLQVYHKVIKARNLSKMALKKRYKLTSLDMRASCFLRLAALRRGCPFGSSILAQDKYLAFSVSPTNGLQSSPKAQAIFANEPMFSQTSLPENAYLGEARFSAQSNLLSIEAKNENKILLRLNIGRFAAMSKDNATAGQIRSKDRLFVSTPFQLCDAMHSDEM
jgi:hypothetical protein